MRRKILYIEDSPDQLELVQTLLERNLPDVMVEARCTVDGAEQALNSACYDLIICDVDLPGELGTAIAARILERDPGQPIYLMSEYVGENVHREAARLGLKLHGKFSTVTAAEFLLAVKVLLERRPCAESAPADRGKSGAAAGSNHFNTDAASSPRSAGATRQEERGLRSSVTSRRPIQLTSPLIHQCRTANGRC